MSEAVHTETYRGFKIEIYFDSDPQNPRKENDNLGKMICFHRRYTLGDDHDYRNPEQVVAELTGVDADELGMGELNDDLGDGSKYRIIWEPLYLYDHSGITMKTTPFSDRWDSGQVGIIYCTYADILKNFGIEPIKPETWEPTKEVIAQVERILESEVKEYDHYLTGSVYGYRVFGPDPDLDPLSELEPDDDEYWSEDEEGSCWGFYGDYDKDYGALSAAKEEIDAIVDKG